MTLSIKVVSDLWRKALLRCLNALKWKTVLGKVLPSSFYIIIFESDQLNEEIIWIEPFRQREGAWKISECIRSSAETSISLACKPIYEAPGLHRTTERAIIHKWRKLGTMANGLRSSPPSSMTRSAASSIQEVRKTPRTTSKELNLQYGRIKTQTQCESERLSTSYCQRSTAIVATKDGTTGY